MPTWVVRKTEELRPSSSCTSMSFHYFGGLELVLDGNRAALQKTPRKSQVSGVEIVSTETIDSGCENDDTVSHSNVLWESVVCSARATPPSVISTTLTALALENHIQKSGSRSSDWRRPPKITEDPKTLLADQQANFISEEKTKNVASLKALSDNACVRRVQLPVVGVEARCYFREGAL